MRTHSISHTDRIRHSDLEFRLPITNETHTYLLCGHGSCFRNRHHRLRWCCSRSWRFRSWSRSFRSWSRFNCWRSGYLSRSFSSLSCGSRSRSLNRRDSCFYIDGKYSKLQKDDCIRNTNRFYSQSLPCSDIFALDTKIYENQARHSLVSHTCSCFCVSSSEGVIHDFLILPIIQRLEAVHRKLCLSRSFSPKYRRRHDHCA